MPEKKTNISKSGNQLTWRKDIVKSFEGEGLTAGSGCTHKSTTCKEGKKKKRSVTVILINTDRFWSTT